MELLCTEPCPFVGGTGTRSFVLLEFHQHILRESWHHPAGSVSEVCEPLCCCCISDIYLFFSAAMRDLELELRQKDDR